MLELPFIDRIWTAKGHVVLDPPRSPANTFACLDTLLATSGTEYEVDGDTLTYSLVDDAGGRVAGGGEAFLKPPGAGLDIEENGVDEGTADVDGESVACAGARGVACEVSHMSASP